MARTFSRADNSILSKWWWNIDRWIFTCIISLLIVGIILAMASSPAVAERINLESFYFVKRHAIYVILFLIVMLGVSLLSEVNLQRFALILFGVTIALLILTPIIGTEIKGAKRWINLAGFSIQPSEFIKPALVILTAWMLAEKKLKSSTPGNIFAFIFYSMTIALLLLQPDMGMVILITLIFFFQFFLAGLPLSLILLISLVSVGGLLSSYFLFSHVQTRVDRFLFPDPTARFSERYQITQSLDAFNNGGFWGAGPGEGTIKKYLPDAHADFIFSVAGEEYGLILCIIIVALFSVIMIRSISAVFNTSSFFVLFATAGLVFEICLQAFINMASTLDLIPTKGMTLPFISFGGSSILSVGITAGALLGLTKRKFGMNQQQFK